MDRLWTNPGSVGMHADIPFSAHRSRKGTENKLDKTYSGQFLDFRTFYFGSCRPFTVHGQNWDRLSTWTNSGQNPDIMAHQLLDMWKDVNLVLPKYHGPLLAHLPPTHGPLKAHLKPTHGRLQPSHGPLAAHPWTKPRLEGQPTPWDMEDIYWALPE